MRTYRRFGAEDGPGSLPEDSHEVLDEAVNVLADHSDLRLEFREYTDPAEQNTSPSRRRADAVKQYLVEQGIAADEARHTRAEFTPSMIN